MRTTSIEWAHATFNPWWGCVKVSPGCASCYAEAFDRRTFGKAPHAAAGGEIRQPHWGAAAPRRTFGPDRWREPVRWNAAAARKGRRRRVFCASMADVLEDRRDLDEWRALLWPLIVSTPWLDWLLLTKRPENARALMPAAWWSGSWPSNAWYGVTVEDKERAVARLPFLLEAPARIRFVSAEPLLEAVDFRPWLGARSGGGVSWIIVGGESGPRPRVFAFSWARAIRDACRSASVPFFMKQAGSAPFSVVDRIGFRGMTESRPNGFYRYLNEPKGGDPGEWPADLRVREVPA